MTRLLLIALAAGCTPDSETADPSTPVDPSIPVDPSTPVDPPTTPPESCDEAPGAFIGPTFYADLGAALAAASAGDTLDLCAAGTTTLVGCEILRNGLGAQILEFSDPSLLVSEDSDWGTGADDNDWDVLPLFGQLITGYGAGATFSSNQRECTPGP